MTAGWFGSFLAKRKSVPLKAGAAVVGVGVGFGDSVPSALATDPITPAPTHPISPVITVAL
jgi:hypothetical protein